LNRKTRELEDDVTEATRCMIEADESLPAVRTIHKVLSANATGCSRRNQGIREHDQQTSKPH
jgi:hypothetical protein